MYSIISHISINGNWLITANLLLSTLLLLWVLRYRTLYRIHKSQANLFEKSLDELNEGFYRTSLDGELLMVNNSLAHLCGINDRKKLLELSREALNNWYVEPERREKFLQELRTDGVVENFVSEVRNIETGELSWISENAHVVDQSESNQSAVYEGSVVNITDRIQRGKVERLLDKLSDNLPGGLFQIACDRRRNCKLVYASKGFNEVMEIDEKGELGTDIFKCRIVQTYLAQYTNSLIHSIERKIRWNAEFKIRRRDGSEIWIGLIATPEIMPDHTLVFHGHIIDISERKEAEAKVAYYAYYDPLTKLPNRQFFMHQLQKSVASSQRSGRFGAVLFLDIDNFKLLNDTQGHSTGDKLLKEVATRLNSCVRANDSVSRFGGDEFVILLDEIGDVEESAMANASKVAQKIINQFNRGFRLGSKLHDSSPSIGVVTFDGKNGDGETLIQNADIAMYEAKKLGRNNFVTYDSDKTASNSVLVGLQNHLGDAIKNKELSVYYQPQVNQNGIIYGAEALIRWEHPELGLLSPKDILPLAEQSDQIGDLNNFVLEQSIEDLAKWRAAGCNRDFRVSVNISSQQLRRGRYLDWLVEISQSNSVPLSLVTFEVTENSMTRDFDLMRAKMQDLKTLGAKLSLDDFGTGHSSLSQLNKLPFDEVKIEGSYIADLEKNTANQSLVEALMAAAKALDLDIVAEHVNTSFQERFLLAHGCRRFQGFIYSPPIPETQFCELLLSGKEMKISVDS